MRINEYLINHSLFMAGCLEAVYCPDSEVPLGSKRLYKEDGNRQVAVNVASPYNMQMQAVLRVEQFFLSLPYFLCNVTFDLLLQQ